MRIVIFGANGPTGRLLTRLSLTAGYDTVAVTRQPGTFGVQSPRLRVAGADVLDADAVDSLVEGSDADWTILRPSGLYELPEVTDYSLTEEHGPGRFTARIDLAAAILRQVTDDRFVRRTGHVITTRDNPGLLSMMLREAFGK
jgi:uncharacterized protein YbjT (DUF2867 family)